MLYALFRIGRRLAMFLSPRAGYNVATAVGDIFYCFAKEDRKNLWHNLKIATGISDRRLLRKYTKNIFRNFAKCLVDFFRFEKMDSNYMRTHISVAGKENLDRALAKGKGVIALSAHLGNWEMGAAAVTNLGYAFCQIALEHGDKRIDDFFARQRAFPGIKAIAPGSAQLKNCFKILKKNGILAIASDRDLTNNGISVNFCGRDAIMPKGAAAFSLKTGAPIVPTFLVRRGSGPNYDLIFDKPIEGKATGDKDADIRSIMKNCLSTLEAYVKRFPDQWCVFQKIWE
ncbi:MAG: lysophospholipid acyltransferase family protein [Omnitrophica bacterium]|nr:lysophospholipid acyltransferase family protein [Candidatus Omnitrophota bacterium]